MSPKKMLSQHCVKGDGSNGLLSLIKKLAKGWSGLIGDLIINRILKEVYKIEKKNFSIECIACFLLDCACIGSESLP